MKSDDLQRFTKRHVKSIVGRAVFTSFAHSLLLRESWVVVAFHRVNEFESRREGAFLAYLRTILLNSVRDELRRSVRRPQVTELDEELMRDEGPSILDELIGRDKMRRYEEALERLTEEQREAVILRIEFGMSHREVADAMGKPNADAARMTVSRALAQRARALGSE